MGRDDLTPATKNKLTVLMTVTQPDSTAIEEFQSILSGHRPEHGQEEVVAEEDYRSQLEKAHELIKDRLGTLGWEEMEELVAAILRAMGYKSRVSPTGPDRGKDVVASPDGLGLEQPRIKVEVKHRKTKIGADQVRSFLGGLRPGDKGLYVSTGGFSQEARYEAERANLPLTLIDLDTLAEVLVQYYDDLDAEGRALLPLTRIFWPAE